MAKIDQLQDGATFGEQRGKINQALKSVETDSTITGDGDSYPLSVVAENIKANSTDQSLVLAPDGVGGVEFRAEQGGGGTGDHTQLINRDVADQHPISAITGLTDQGTGDNYLSDDGTYKPVSGGVTPPTTNEPVTAALKFDKDYIATTANRLVMSGDTTLSLEGTHTPQVGKVNFFEIECNGTNAINLSNDFKSSAIQPSDLNGKVLDAKTYQFGTMYFPDGIGINAMQVDGTAPTVPNPTITSGTMASDNTYVDVAFNVGIYATGGSGAVALGAFNVSFNQGSGSATAWTASSVTNTSGGALVGGETTIRINGTATGTPDGNETVTVTPTDGNSLFNSEGTAMADTETTGAISLINQTIPQLSTPTLNSPTMGQTTADLTVSSNITNNSGYQFDYKETSSGTWLDGGTSAQDVLTKQITGLTSGTQYDFRVKALGDNVNFTDSNYSATVQGTTQADTGTQPNLMAGSTVNYGNNSKFELAFDVPVWGNSANDTPISINAFNASLSGGTATNIILTSLTDIYGNPLTGGEQSIIISYTYSGVADATEIATVTVNENEVYNGGLSAVSQTTNFNLWFTSGVSPNQPEIGTPSIGNTAIESDFSASLGSSWDIWYKTRTSDVWLFSQTVTLKQFLISNLTKDTDYDIRLRGYSSNNLEASIFSNTYEFKTTNTTVSFNPVTDAYQFADFTSLSGNDGDSVNTISDSSGNGRSLTSVYTDPIIQDIDINGENTRTLLLGRDLYTLDTGITNIGNVDSELYLAVKINNYTLASNYLFGLTQGDYKYIFSTSSGNIGGSFSKTGSFTGYTVPFWGAEGDYSHIVLRIVSNFTGGFKVYLGDLFLGGFTPNENTLNLPSSCYLAGRGGTTIKAVQDMYFTKFAYYDRVLTLDESAKVIENMSI